MYFLVFEQEKEEQHHHVENIVLYVVLYSIHIRKWLDRILFTGCKLHIQHNPCGTMPCVTRIFFFLPYIHIAPHTLPLSVVVLNFYVTRVFHSNHSRTFMLFLLSMVGAWNTSPDCSRAGSSNSNLQPNKKTYKSSSSTVVAAIETSTLGNNMAKLSFPLHPFGCIGCV